MNAFFGIAIITGIIYGIFIDGTYFKIYFGLLAIYHVVTQHILINRKELTKRKGILVTSWDGKLYIFSFYMCLILDYRTRRSSFVHSY